MTATIIIPVYNRSGLVLRCLDSIRAQTFRPLRVVVVDNASSDNTPEVISRWATHARTPDFSVTLLSEPRRGAAIARQTGFEASDSDVVFFFDSDDTMEPTLVATVMEKFAARPEAEMVGWPVRMHAIGGAVQVTHGLTGDRMTGHLIHGVLRTQGYAVKSDFFRRHGGWHPEMTGWDDWELGVRLLLGRPRLIPLREAPVDVYCRPDSITGTDFSSKEGEWEKAIDAVEASITSSDMAGKERDRLLRIVEYRRVILAAYYHREGNGRACDSLLWEVRKSGVLKRRHHLFLNFALRYTSLGLRGMGRLAPLFL